MIGLVRRLSLTALIAAATLALTAAPAAATSAATSPATGVTGSTAILNGAIVAPGPFTIWQFQYGKTKSYGKTTKAVPVAAQSGTVFVSQQVFNLSPGTTYHFRLVSISGNGTTAYPIKSSFGADLTFTTKRTGKLVLLRSKLSVSGGHVSIPLKCRSNHRCKGTLSITATRNGQKRTCVTKGFAIAAGRKRTLHPRVSRGCRAFLRRAHGHRLHAGFQASLTTRQAGVSRRVTLVRK